MFNKVILVGNLTKDIELRYTPSGSAIASSGIAVNKRYKTQSGEQREDVCFVDISIFGRSAEIANQYLHKGSKVLIDGELKFDTWVDNNNQNKSKHSVKVDTFKMLDGKPSGENQTYQPQPSPQVKYENKPMQQPQRMTRSQEIPDIDIDEDEIPF